MLGPFLSRSPRAGYVGPSVRLISFPSSPLIWPKPCSKGPQRINPIQGLPMGTKWSEAVSSPSLPLSMLRAAQSGPPERPGPPQRALLMPGAKVSLYARAERAPTQAGIQLGWGFPRLWTQRKTCIAHESVIGVRASPPRTSPGCRLRNSPVWTGAGQSPRGRSAELCELSKPVAFKGGSPCAPSSGAPGGHEGVLRVGFSVPGPDEAQATKCRRAGECLCPEPPGSDDRSACVEVVCMPTPPLVTLSACN